ncbi:MAG: Fe-S biogenesis protein NfuA [Candidatus Dasytiphilus stammeri]
MININITSRAQEHFKTLLQNQEPGTQIRIFVINPDSPQAECGVSYCSPNTISKTDIQLRFDHFYAYIDLYSAPWLEGAEIDLISDELGSQLILNAPNVKKSWTNQENPNVSLRERVDGFLQERINPQLASHGGSVNLIEITNEGYVILKFSGGCNGCSMVNLTVKEYIEKELLIYFPKEIRGVRDITEHQRSVHSYF